MNGISEKPFAGSAPGISPPASPVLPVLPMTGLQVRSFVPFAIAAGVLVLLFCKPLFELVQYSFREDFYSHIILIPFICAYLIWTDRQRLPALSRDGFAVALGPGLLGVGIILGWFAFRDGLSANDSLTWTILSFCLFLTALVLLFFGSPFARSIVFPLSFLFFIVPFPEAVTNAFEIGSQKASAEVYSWMLVLTGTPFLRYGQEFRIPGLSLIVAQECSGIRSSFVLLITSLLAGHMFLRSPRRKAFLAFAVIPLGIVRNGFRVLVLSLLTIHVDPRVIDSPLHHRGGPIFFALSLIPFFLLLFWLRKTEKSTDSRL